MFSRIRTEKFTENFSDSIKRLKKAIEETDKIVIGAGAGLSAASGFDYGGERFRKYFSDFEAKYNIHDMYSGGFYPFATFEEYWAWWSRHILVNRYDCPVGRVYEDLLALVKNKDYFVITTNVDSQFLRAGFDKKRLFCTQGDYGLWQCSKPCHNKTYGNEKTVRKMVALQKDMKIPTELIPKCPECGAPMTVNLRCDDKFVEDSGWHSAAKRYTDFLGSVGEQKILFFELGVGYNTPAVIKYPFWRMTAKNPNAIYACINKNEMFCPAEIADRAVCVDADISTVIKELQ